MADAEGMREAIGRAIGVVLAGESEMVTRWVAMVETMDADGERAVWALCPPEAKPWDSLGLLTFGIQLEQAGVTNGTDDD